jgi:peptide deformylase
MDEAYQAADMRPLSAPAGGGEGEGEVGEAANCCRHHVAPEAHDPIAVGSASAAVEPSRPGRYIRRMSSETIQRLPILVAPHPSLKARARPVGTADADAVRDLVPRMLAAMYEAPGIGLAAPQVGVGLRLAVVDLMPGNKPAPMVLINPRVAAASRETAIREEGCLSLPGQYADVERPAVVSVQYEDETGTRRTLEATGLLGACLQHEIDHLDGVLFVDHLSALKRNMILRRLAKEQRQKREEAASR